VGGDYFADLVRLGIGRDSPFPADHGLPS